MSTIPLYRKKKQELIELAVQYGLPTDGTRDELVEKIRNYLESQDNTDDNSYNTLNSPNTTTKKKFSKENGSPAKLKRSRSESVQHVKSEPDDEDEISKHTEVFANNIKIERDIKAGYEGEGSGSAFYNEDIEDIGDAAAEVAQEMAEEAKQVYATLESETSDLASFLSESGNEFTTWVLKTLKGEHVYARMKDVRRRLSKSITILQGTLLFEGLVYLRTSLPRTYKVTIDPTYFGRLVSDEANTTFHLPNLSLLLHTDFWYPLFTWLFVLIIFPLAVSFFINFDTRKHHWISPLTFAVARYCLIMYASRNWEILDTLFTRISPFLLLMSSGLTGVFSTFESFVKH